MSKAAKTQQAQKREEETKIMTIAQHRARETGLKDLIEQLQGHWLGIETGKQGECTMLVEGSTFTFHGANPHEWYRAMFELVPTALSRPTSEKRAWASSGSKTTACRLSPTSRVCQRLLQDSRAIATLATSSSGD
jgi:hypothetical protein